MNISHKLTRKFDLFWWGVGIITCLGAAAFVLIGLRGNAFGFPLDDAWIHQTYARNLAQSSTWSFIPGKISGGSTSPLWTVLLSFGYKISQNFAWSWTLALSICALGLMVVLLGKSLPGNTPLKVLFAILVGFEWHLNWAVGSGMETILYCLGISALVFLLFNNKYQWGWVGGVLGALVWIRPDGLTLLGPVGLTILFLLKEKKVSFKSLIPGILIFIGIVTGYLIFNHATTGQIFPNTFYAKQMEYRELYTTSYIQRVFEEFKILIIGPGIVVFPGFIYSIYHGIKAKSWNLVAFALWVLGFGLIYAWRLPVTYQHGRYMIPVLPVYLLVGTIGCSLLLQRIQKNSIRKICQFAFYVFGVLVTVGFFALGITTYRQDVTAINTLMVEPARYVEENTKPSDLIAVHDIGAMGYFSGRQIVDLAGLVNPEVIPFIRDENKLFEYMKASGVDYFVCLDDWYKNSASWGQEIERFSLKVDKTVKTTVVLKLK